MIIPNAEYAVIDIRKLRDYTLNPTHRVGKHKARLFVSLLGMSRENAEALRDLLLHVMSTHDAELGEQDEHGQRYRIDFLLTWRGRQAPIRSVWNVRPNEDFPRFVTCYPMKKAGV